MQHFITPLLLLGILATWADGAEPSHPQLLDALVDDFLASGQTILGLARLAEASGSKIVGIGALVEKIFEGGRDALSSLGVPIESIACIKSLDDGKITFV